MKIIHLTCNHCGAPLEIAEEAKFATCRFCSSRLAIEHSDSAVYTRVLEALENQTNTLSRDLETIKIQNEIDRLDREWEMQREQLCHRTKSGRLVEPTVVKAGCLAVFQLIFGVVWFAVGQFGAHAVNSSLPGFASLIGLLIAASAIVTYLFAAQRARTFHDVRSNYESRRCNLIDELDRRTGRREQEDESSCP